MNILLIYPKFPDTFWSFPYALRFIGKKAVFPPLGLITVAALLPKQSQLRLVDLIAGGLADGDFAWADITFTYTMAVHLIDRCKDRGLEIISYGPFFTGEPDAFERVDHLVIDEAEATLPVFIAETKVL